MKWKVESEKLKVAVRKFLRIFFLCFSFSILNSEFSVIRAQSAEGSAEWSAAVSPVEGVEGEYKVMFEVRVTPGWHIYDLGPYTVPGLATGFDFSASRGVELVGEPYEAGTPVHKHDEVFGFETGYFEMMGRFGQRVRATEPGSVLTGEIEYQICRDEVGCIRGVWDFSIPVGEQNESGEVAVSPNNEGRNEYGTDTFRNLTGRMEFDPTDSATLPEAEGISRGDATTATGGGSLWAMILEAILWGFAALLTPCVFPMAPMTISFFMKENQSSANVTSLDSSSALLRNTAGSRSVTTRARLRGATFGLFIIALYTLPIAVIILIARLAGGEAVTADIFNWLSTHWIPNVLFFIVFMAFAASLLGAFEMRMPSWLVNRSDRGAEKAGLVGVFFLALTLVLVSFSCTGPIVGTVLIKSTQGEFWAPILTMFVFSTAFALPFIVLAFFPKMLERLPKSGGWMNSVKVVLALIEIALGLKFLSVADQTYHWGILDREVYLAIWIVVFSIMGFYLLGKIRFKYDSPTPHVGVWQLGLAILVFSFVVRIIPGMWGAPLSAISGYLPPMSTQEFAAGRNADGGFGYAENGRVGTASADKIKYSDILHLPHGMAGYFDFEQGIAAARAVDKPVFLDFTGHGCVNCREMEARVWVDPEVQRILREDYVVIALYSDDRTTLSEAEWLTTPAGKVLKSMGRKNSYIINTRYGVSAQPAYLLLDGGGELLIPVYGYSLDVAKYVAFLRSGVEAYNLNR